VLLGQLTDELSDVSVDHLSRRVELGENGVDQLFHGPRTVAKIPHSTPYSVQREIHPLIQSQQEQGVGRILDEHALRLTEPHGVCQHLEAEAGEPTE
jgi:hypothetical protein